MQHALLSSCQTETNLITRFDEKAGCIMSTDKKLSIRGLGKSFPLSGEATPVLTDIDFDVYAGEFVAIVGGSGCGKSTLLRIISGFIKDYSGSIQLNDKTISGPGRDRGFVFQEPRLMPWLTAAQNVAFGLENPKEQRHLVPEYLKLVGLAGFADVYPRQLSGGMAQRCAIARALINKPELLLLDEPFGALDAMTKIYLQEELLKIHKADSSVMIMVTHDIEEAIYLADRIIVMTPRPGRIRKIVHVTEPRPRDRNSPGFVEIKRAIFQEFFATAEQRIEYFI